MAALEGKPCDRVPFWLLFPWHRLGCYVDARNHPDYKPVHEASIGRAIILDRRNIGVPLFDPEVVDYRVEETIENDRKVRQEIHTWKDIELFRIHVDGKGWVKKLLATEEDMRNYGKFPIMDDKDKIFRWMQEKHFDKYMQEKSEFPEHLGSMMLDLGEPVNQLYQQSILEEYALWSVECPEVVEDFLDRVMTQKKWVYQWCLEHNLADVYFMVGSELASPPLVSRKTLQRWIVPYAKELIEMIHSYDKKVIQHYHGHITLILEDFLTMNPDGLHTIEAPPTGDTTFTEAFKRLGEKITLIGNIQYDRFRSASDREMAEETHTVIDECKGHRFILSPSAGPYEEKVNPRIIANYHVFMNTAWNAQWP